MSDQEWKAMLADAVITLVGLIIILALLEWLI